MIKKFFGTDGIRGKAGIFPLEKDFIKKIGFSVSKYFIDKNLAKTKKILIGEDTRESGQMIFDNLALGLIKNNFKVFNIKIVSTPLISILSKDYDFSIMISASHNPYHDNGIKFFSSQGIKFSDEMEKDIENILLDVMDKKIDFSEKLDPKNIINISDSSLKKYLIFYKKIFKDLDLKNKKIVLDLANGSLSNFAKNIFENFNAKILSINDKPDGKNINLFSGSTNIDCFVKFLENKKVDFDLGFSFDGDGDRLIAVKKIDNSIKILNGDYIIGIFAKYLKNKNELKNNAVCITKMSNLGFKKFLKSENIDFYETNVGDKYVYESLEKNDLVLGGENSGHIILKNFASTGDGLLNALFLSKIYDFLGDESFSNIIKNIKFFPQILKNIKFDKNFDIFSNEKINLEYQKIQNILGENGRIFVRFSGTEPLLRIMIEGEDLEQINLLINNFIEIIKTEFLLK